jgi:hypothetical protein
LSLADELIGRPDVPEPAGQFLRKYCSEFLFGTTAPDVQVVSRQRREATHFFSLPILPGARSAWVEFITRYPPLASAIKQQSAHAAFLAGYLCHLQADWLWVKDIFIPTFGLRAAWGSFHQRLYYHNVLRAYLDLQILSRLPQGIGASLDEVTPQAWLPFVKDFYLTRWRQMLSAQLQPDAAIQTVEVFSSRQGTSAAEFYALLGSEERMQSEVFAHFPLERVESYRKQVLADNIRLLSDSLAFSLHPINIPGEGVVSKGVQS